VAEGAAEPGERHDKKQQLMGLDGIVEGEATKPWRTIPQERAASAGERPERHHPQPEEAGERDGRHRAQHAGDEREARPEGMATAQFGSDVGLDEVVEGAWPETITTPRTQAPPRLRRPASRKRRMPTTPARNHGDEKCRRDGEGEQLGLRARPKSKPARIARSAARGLSRSATASATTARLIAGSPIITEVESWM
jgi:hypothetical protein